MEQSLLQIERKMQNEMFGTQIDSLYDEQQMNNTSNNHHSTSTPNQTSGNHDNNHNGGTTAISHGLGGGQMYTTGIHGILTPSPGFLSQSSQQRLPCTNSNSNLLRTRDPNTIFRYSARRNTDDLHYSLSPLTPPSIRLLRSLRKQLRKIPKTPFKVLDALELQDDFYPNLVDWSSTNILAVGPRGKKQSSVLLKYEKYQEVP